jgi:hypothetical protein
MKLVRWMITDAFFTQGYPMDKYTENYQLIDATGLSGKKIH